jgi:hypothetical protein
VTPYQKAEQWLKNNLEYWLKACYPGGKRDGHNFVTGDIDGSEGESFSICLEPEAKRGLYKDFATGEKASRNLVRLYKHARGIPEDDHARFFQDLSSFSGLSFGYNDKGPMNMRREIDWPACVRELSFIDAVRLASHAKRRFLPVTILWLHKQGEVGKYNDKISFPMRSASGAVTGVHRWFEQEGKLKFLGSPTLWSLGDTQAPREVHINESVWDQIALIDRTQWHLEAGKLFLCTRGTSGAKLLRGQIPPGVKVYIWEQHDQPGDNGQLPANEGWRAKAAFFCGCQVWVVRIPPQYKDLNEWTIAGASAEELVAAVSAARPYRPQESEAQQTETKESEHTSPKSDSQEEDDRPELLMPVGRVEYCHTAKELFSGLANRERYFVYGQLIVEMGVGVLLKDKHHHDALIPLEADALRSRIEKDFRCMAWREKHGHLIKVPARCPHDTANVLLKTDQAFELLPPLRTLSASPVLVGESGNLQILGAGYHPTSGVYVHGDEVKLSASVKNARETLLSLLCDYQFVTESDKAIALIEIEPPMLP